MKKIYADTSVIGGCFDIECRQHSIELLEAFKKGSIKVIISDLTMLELAPAKKEIKNKINEAAAADVIQARSNEKAYALAEAYIKAGALTYRNYHDALHIALATVFKADVLASWHPVNIETAVVLNAINMLMGYNKIDILTPTLTLKMINDESRKKLQCN
jgi:predicted nucleic acid-binding protein